MSILKAIPKIVAFSGVSAKLMFASNDFSI